MANYFKIILDSKNRAKYADECRSNGFIGVDYGVDINMEDYLSEDLGEFKNKFIPEYLAVHRGKRKLSDQIAELLWEFCKVVRIGDIVVCPNGRGTLYFGRVVGEYAYHLGSILQHRRAVEWLPATYKRKNISEALNDALKVKTTDIMLSEHAEEIEKCIQANEIMLPQIMHTSKERLLEDFLVEHWEHTELGKMYDIIEEDGEKVGQQYQTDDGRIDILARSKDKKELLVVELKKGRASDEVVGQILRYMGFVKQNLAEKNQVVKGVIVASEDDKSIRNALLATQNIEFFRYHVSVTLMKDSDA